MVSTSLGTGGVQNVVRDLSGGLLDAGHDVGILSLTGTETGVIDPRAAFVRPLGLPDVRIANLPRALSHVISTIREFAPDILHSHAFHSNAVAGAAAALTRTRSVRTIHSTSEGGSAHRRIADLVRRLPGTTVAVSRTVADAAGLGPAAPVVYNGIDCERFEFREQDRHRGRKIVRAQPGEFLIVSVGRLTEAKNYLLLVDAVALAQDALRTRDARVVLVGEGPLRQSINDRVASHGIEDLIHLAGACNSVEIALSAADAYVQSSSREGFPLALLEAMQSGLPVLATRVGGTEEIEPALHRYVPPNNAPELADGLVDLTDLRGHGRRALQADAIATRYGIAAWSSAWVGIYDAVGGR